ncbi:MAG: TonB-dependent receptor [Pseudomonadales bacterium]|jgi:outer membrane receptor protein involved in Fe transport|nr:TonB-dependent receptor [Pseudomonadales bacterium]
MSQSRPFGRVRGARELLLGSIVTLGHVPVVLADQTATATASSPPARSNVVEEVIVSAQRRQESIQDVPIAVSAFSGAMLEDRQIITPSDLQMNTPNVSFSATNFGGASVSIRGIGTLVTGASADPGVSLHLNEIPVGTNLNSTEFYDMERVEVLRGPQGTLFGRNATGGAINFVTKRPDFDETDGFIDVEAGDYGHQRIKGAFNLPINDRLAFRVAGMNLQRDGYITNTAFGQTDADGNTLPGIDDDVDGRDLYSYRVTGEWAMTDRSNLWVVYQKFKEDSDRVRITNQVCQRNSVPTIGCLPNGFGFDSPHLGSTTGGIFGGGIGALPAGVRGDETDIAGLNYAFPQPEGMGFRDMHTDFEPVFQNEEDLFAFGFDYEFQNMSFGLIGAYQETEYLQRQDYLMDVGPTLNPVAGLNPDGLWPTSLPAGRAGEDFGSGPCNYTDGTFGVEGGCIAPVDQTRVFAYDQSSSKGEYWTLEAKLASSFEGPFNFVAGVNTYEGEAFGDYYVLANTLDLVTNYGNPALAAPPLYPGAFNSASNPQNGTLRDGYAIYGETYFDLTPSLKLTIGMRYNEDNKEVNDTSVLFNAVDVGALAALPDRLWSRITGFVLGAPASPADLALTQLYGVSQADIDAAAITGPLSPERLAINAQVPIIPGFNEQRILTGSPTEDTWKEWTGRIGLDWQVNDESMVYGFLSRGYKPGGFNPAIPPDFQDTSAFTFASEEIDAIEIGTKNVFMDGRMTLNGTFFAYDYGGLQVTRIANNSSINDNIDAQIWGIELEGMWRPETLPQLAVDWAYSYLDTAVDGDVSLDPTNRTGGDPDWILLNNIDPGSLTGVNYIAREADITGAIVDAALFPATGAPGALDIRNDGTVVDVSQTSASGVSVPAYFSRAFLNGAGVETSDGIPVDIDGNQLPNSPENTIHIGVQYTWDVPALAGSITPRWDYYWQDDMYAREFNTGGDFIEAWDQHNASLIYESFDGHWQLRAWVRNLQNGNNVTGHYLTSDTSGFFRNYFLTEPRIWGVSARYQLSGN